MPPGARLYVNPNGANIYIEGGDTGDTSSSRFIGGSGSIVPDPVYFSSSSSTSESFFQTSFIYANKIFKEWNTFRDGSGSSYSIGETINIPVTTTLFAIWVDYDITLSYKGSTIATISASGTEVLETEGKYCEDDITVTYTKTAGSASTPATTITANPTISVSSSGLITASVSGSQSVTPTVSAGYVSSGTAGTITVSGSNTSQLTTQAAQTITPTTTNQTISSGRYLTGDQTILGDINLVASNIASGISIFGVAGTFAGGGDDLKNFIEQHDTITSFSNSTISAIGSGAFYRCNSLRTLSLPACTSIGSEAFGNCIKLSTANFPVCTNIGSSAFMYCHNLTTASFPLCTSIGSNAFMYCYSLTTISFPVCTSIGSGAFGYCSRALTTASFPSCTYIAGNAFTNCYSLATISFPSCTYIGPSAFTSCSNLTTASFPLCTSIDKFAFSNCDKLTTVSIPLCVNINSYAFAYCSSLTTVNFPLCTSIGNYVFSFCLKLTTVSLPSCTYIGNNAFDRCYSLLSLYLTGSSIASLSNSNAFKSTPIAEYTASTGGVYGSIFVPSSLYSTYIAATNWTYFSSRIVSV